MDLLSYPAMHQDFFARSLFVHSSQSLLLWWVTLHFQNKLARSHNLADSEHSTMLLYTHNSHNLSCRPYTGRASIEILSAGKIRRYLDSRRGPHHRGIRMRDNKLEKNENKKRLFLIKSSYYIITVRFLEIVHLTNFNQYRLILRTK